MERLTNRDKKPISLTPQNGIRWMAIYHKLKQYEDAEENGLLVRLPLKKGSKVYSAKEEYTVTEISCFDDFELKFIAKNDYSAIHFNVKEIGKTVFLTQAEAEAKLKEIEAKLKEMEGKYDRESKTGNP